MENNEDYMVNIVDSNGNPGVVEVLDIFEVDGYDKEYIMYSKGENVGEDKEKLYFAILNKNDDGSYTFENIEDDKEWEDVQRALDESDDEILKEESI